MPSRSCGVRTHPGGDVLVAPDGDSGALQYQIAGGTRLVSEFLELGGLSTLVGVSDGAQHKLNAALETALVTDVEAQRTASWRGHGASASNGVRGRNVPSGGLLGGHRAGVELHSAGGVRRGSLCGDLDGGAGRGLHGPRRGVIQSTADEAKALRRHAETDLGAHHSPDLFHGQLARCPRVVLQG
jgi:hypothetical protein